MSCRHVNMDAQVRIARFEDTGGFMAEVRITCIDCKLPFQFLGLEPGCDTQGARVSLDGLEANIAICPAGSKPNPMQRISYQIDGSGPGPAGHN